MKELSWVLFIFGLLAFVACDSSSSSTDSLLFQHKKFCTKGNLQFNVGETFDDPANPCRECICCKTGRFKCRAKQCALPPCGTDYYMDRGDDECCFKCEQVCVETPCPVLNCKGPEYFKKDECCGTCGCFHRGLLVPPGPIENDVTSLCEQCTCHNGTVTCLNEAPCPEERLKCVDARVSAANGCAWECPYGQSCSRGEEVIYDGEYREIGEKLCTCVSTIFPDKYYPFAACANKDHWGAFEEKLHDTMCVKKPIAHTFWT